MMPTKSLSSFSKIPATKKFFSMYVIQSSGKWNQNISQEGERGPDTVAHSCNPSYSRDGDQRITVQVQSRQKCEPLTEK
jgi:hypothetical protein